LGRIGIGVSRQLGSHARRNRVRRQVREAAIATAPGPAQYLDWVIIVGKAGEAKTFEEWKQVLATLWAVASGPPESGAE